jgi:hypothetical protein
MSPENPGPEHVVSRRNGPPSKKYALEEWVEEAGADFYKDTHASVKTGIDEAKSAAPPGSPFSGIS